MMNHFCIPCDFKPIHQYRLWEGRRLAGPLEAALPEGQSGKHG